MDRNLLEQKSRVASVAQLDSVLDFESKGSGFDPLHLYLLPGLANDSWL